MQIQEIKKQLENQPTEDLLAMLRMDGRVGVQKLLASYEKKVVREQQEIQRLNTLYEYENKLRQEGHKIIAGVDEAGRGPLAGPLVVAAVALPENHLFHGLDDSKQVPEKRRAELFDEIYAHALAVSVDIIAVETIDAKNIYQATLDGMRNALLTLPLQPDCALIDAMPLTNLPFPTISLIHGDSLSASIAAASIVAKVTRDRIMAELDASYPGYGFARNKGYGAELHMEALARQGATPVHRKTFEPLKSMLSGGGMIEYPRRGTTT